MKKLSFLILFYTSVLFVSAQDFDRAKLDSLMAHIDAHNKAMGSLSLFQAGKEVYHYEMGYADVANKIEANADTKYRIGSISKTFTATLILQLVEEGKLSLDTKLKQFYPKIPNADKISVEDMLRHRSGLFNFTNLPEFKEYMLSPQSKADMLARFRKLKVNFEAGEKMEYSNTNYVLLAYMIEDLEGEPFSEVLRRRIVEPLQLKDTYYGAKISSQADEAFSYRKLKDWTKAEESDMSIPSGAGGIVSNPRDLNIFLSALLEGKLISEESLEKMLEIKDNYGLGVFPFPFYGRKAFGHNGSIDGFRSSAGYFKEEKLGIAYVSNGVDLNPNDILVGALSIYFNREYSFPEFAPAMELSAEDLAVYEGTYGSKAFPLDIKIFREGNQLMAQAEGQSAFPLEAYEEHRFRYEAAKIKIEFKPQESTLNFSQGGRQFELTKKD